MFVSSSISGVTFMLKAICIPLSLLSFYLLSLIIALNQGIRILKFL